MDTTTAAVTATVSVEDGQVVYPCRCGETHRGLYAIYEYGHCNCFHPSPLLDIGYDIIMCGMCGNAWELKKEQEPAP